MSELPSFRDFEAAVGTTFRLDQPEGKSVDLTLTAVTDKTPEGFGGKQFSVLFHGPGDAPLIQSIHQLVSDGLGSVSLFLVPIGEEDGGRIYEAFFNLLTSDAE